MISRVMPASNELQLFIFTKWCGIRIWIESFLVWVIFDNLNNIFGFGHLKFHEKSKAEIGGLYFVPEIVGQGLGKKIFRLMLDECRKRDVHSISLTATKTAKAFYENVGFKQLGPQSLLKIGNKEIECFKMLQTIV